MNDLEDLEDSCKVLQDGINLQQAQLDEHKAMIQLLKDKPSKVCQRVANGSKYWRIDPYGSVVSWSDKRDATDNYSFLSGNYYYSEQEAQKALNKQLATMRIFDKLRELEGDWEADWNDNSHKYTYFVKLGNVNTTSWCQRRSSNDLRWYSSEKAIDWVFENMMPDLRLAWECK